MKKYQNIIGGLTLALCVLSFVSSIGAVTVRAQATASGSNGGYVQNAPAANGSNGGYVQQAPSQQTTTFTLQNPLKVNSIGGLVQNFVEIFSYIVILLGVLVLIYVGFEYILASAQGNSAKIKELHMWLLWVVVGIAIVLAARVMVDIVINTISATGAISPGVIQSAHNASAGN